MKPQTMLLCLFLACLSAMPALSEPALAMPPAQTTLYPADNIDFLSCAYSLAEGGTLLGGIAKQNGSVDGLLMLTNHDGTLEERILIGDAIVGEHTFVHVEVVNRVDGVVYFATYEMYGGSEFGVRQHALYRIEPDGAVLRIFAEEPVQTLLPTANGFVLFGQKVDPIEGTMERWLMEVDIHGAILWRCDLPPCLPNAVALAWNPHDQAGESTPLIAPFRGGYAVLQTTNWRRYEPAGGSIISHGESFVVRLDAKGQYLEESRIHSAQYAGLVSDGDHLLAYGSLNDPTQQGFALLLDERLMPIEIIQDLDYTHVIQATFVKDHGFALLFNNPQPHFENRPSSYLRTYAGDGSIIAQLAIPDVENRVVNALLYQEGQLTLWGSTNRDDADGLRHGVYRTAILLP